MENPDILKFKLLNQIEENKKNNCGILDFIISPKGSYCHYSPPRTKNPATGLLLATSGDR
jgi:hypothetical protein